MIFIDSQVVADEGMGALVRELFIWIVEDGDVVSCVTAVVLAVTGGRIKSDGGRVTPGTTPGTTPGRVRGGRPAEHNTNRNCYLLLHTCLLSHHLQFPFQTGNILVIAFFPFWIW